MLGLCLLVVSWFIATFLVGSGIVFLFSICLVVWFCCYVGGWFVVVGLNVLVLFAGLFGVLDFVFV